MEMLTTQCQCGRGECMSPWGCVADACGHLYSREAYAAQLDALRRPLLELVEQKLEVLHSVPAEQEAAAATELRDWLEATFGKIRCSVRDARGEPPPRYSTGPVTVVIEVLVHGQFKPFHWSPQRRTSAEVMLPPDPRR